MSHTRKEVEEAAWRIEVQGSGTRQAAEMLMDLQGDNEHLRRLLALAHSGSNLYTDDGALSDSSVLPVIDYLHMSPREIEEKIIERNQYKVQLTVQGNPNPANMKNACNAVVETLFEMFQWHHEVMGAYNVIRHDGETMIGITFIDDEARAARIVNYHNTSLRAALTEMSSVIPPKPFPAHGAWFATDIMGNPMRQVSPGKWENLVPSEQVRLVPRPDIGVNPKFWIQAIRTALHTTDCASKQRSLTNAANALERYIDAICVPQA